ncbi:YrdB family protein [Streptomyces sp. FH025]|uniref:YrdB family protein n=1 Tax=Streptomyces sp. FH025 TaxID=2815937 RepID=UPI001A9D7060|nr:YrdB family protein [Streptomyces sp. FH025]MBO1420132.1 YrdB family protein [Streptomyces sp. FH025]
MRIERPGPVGQRQWTPLTATNAGLAFGLELAMLAALCYWGFKTGSSLGTRLLLGIGAPALAAAAWGLFLAAGGPRFRQPLAVEIVLKLLVLGVAALALHATGRTTLAAVYGALVVVSVAVEYTAN